MYDLTRHPGILQKDGNGGGVLLRRSCVAAVALLCRLFHWNGGICRLVFLFETVARHVEGRVSVLQLGRANWLEPLLMVCRSGDSPAAVCSIVSFVVTGFSNFRDNVTGVSNTCS